MDGRWRGEREVRERLDTGVGLKGQLVRSVHKGQMGKV